MTDVQLRAMIAGCALGIAGLAYWAWSSDHGPQSRIGVTAPANAQSAPSIPRRQELDSVDLSDAQLDAVKVEPVQEREFPVEKEAVGSVDFNEYMTSQVFTPYQGRIIALFAAIGDDVKKGQTLFTIDSPDLLQAESSLIAASGVFELTSRNLKRLQELYASRAVSQHELDQAISDHQTAEGNLKVTRDAVRIFGKSETEINQIVTQRKPDSTLVVASPINGRITARNASPGVLVQPGIAPAPYTVADIDTMWMVANVAELDSPAFRVGQQEQIRISAFPGRVFAGKVTAIGAAVDPATRRVLVRSEINDPAHELRSGMFANFVISVGPAMRSPVIPLDGVVREGDGTTAAWITADRRRFTRRTVKIGAQRDGHRQILEGVQVGELAATEGAIFLSNRLATAH